MLLNVLEKERHPYLLKSQDEESIRSKLTIWTPVRSWTCCVSWLVYLTHTSPVLLYMQHMQHVPQGLCLCLPRLRYLSNICWETVRGVQVLMRKTTAYILLNGLHMNILAFTFTSMQVIESYLQPLWKKTHGNIIPFRPSFPNQQTPIYQEDLSHTSHHHD